MKRTLLLRVLPPPLVSVPLLVGTILLLAPISAVAQLGGENIRGDYGMKSGTQGPPGFYLGNIFFIFIGPTL